MKPLTVQINISAISRISVECLSINLLIALYFRRGVEAVPCEGAALLFVVCMVAPYIEAIRARMSSTFQAVVRGPSFTGCG